MKGVVFNLLRTVVEDHHGEDAWDDLLDAAGVDGIYTSLGSYDHRELLALAAAVGKLRGLADDDVLRWFGRAAIPHFAQRYEDLFTPHRDMRSFVLTLNDIIHPAVRKLYPGAEVPEFEFDTSAPEVLRFGYRSSRGMCAFGEGLLAGAADHWGESVAISQPRCVHRGDEHCVFEARTAE